MRNPILQKKKSEHEKVVKAFGLSQNKILGIVYLENKEIQTKLIEGLKTLQGNFIVVWEGKSEENILFQKEIKEEFLIGCDCIIADEEISGLEKYMKEWVVPIISKKNYLSSLLSEFNPMKNEGNAFIYEQNNAWQVFYALCRYIENAKFSFDNQNLINNVTKI